MHPQRCHRWWATVAGSVLLVVLGCGVAFAVWSTTGSGTGAARSGTLQSVTVSAFTAGDSPNATLVPGGAADVMLRMTNPNSAAVQLYSVVANGQITADAGHSGCTTTGVSFVAPATPVGITLAANSTTLVHLPGAASMNTASLSACQGASFRIPVTVTVHQ